MATAAAFFSSEAETLERTTDIENTNEKFTLEQVWSGKHRKVTSGWIRQNGYKKVCLQFPDHLLPYSNAISDSLKAALGSGEEAPKVFILADTTYGSCCVDEIAAAHVEADSVVHFGNACRSKVSRLPVLYVFPTLPFDLRQCLQQLGPLKTACRDKELCVYLDIGYHHVLEDHLDDADEECLNIVLRESLPCKVLHIEVYPPSEDAASDYKPSEERLCLFIGSDNNNFCNLSLTTQAAQWFIYDPVEQKLNEKNPLTANYVRRRYYYIEKCKDARTLGLIVATLTAEGYLEVIERLQHMAKSRNIKTQIISVGRINPAKLANFLEIDCFVLIGCPFNNLYTAKDFYKPIVSVFEAEMALNPAWHMKYPESYVTDFKELLPNGPRFLAFDPVDITENDVSLVSGRMRSAGLGDDQVEVADTSALSEQQRAVVTRAKMEIMTSDTGLTFEDRTWQGLDPALGLTEPAKVEKGLSGIPVAYTHD